MPSQPKQIVSVFFVRCLADVRNCYLPLFYRSWRGTGRIEDGGVSNHEERHLRHQTVQVEWYVGV
jgi:hypothetical protein